MALLSPQLQRFLLTKYNCSGGGGGGAFKTTTTTNTNKNSGFCNKSTIPLCSAIAIDAPGSSSAAVAGVRWGSTSLQGAREEMEDGVVVRSDGLDGYSFAAVFDGHAGFSSVKFLRDELYKECCAALQGGLLLSGKDIKAIREALQEAFEKVDAKLLDWLERNGEEDESGSTATVMFVGNDMLFISHVGDSSVVQSCSGKAEVLTGPHRPYGSNKIVNGRICGDIAVSRAFGDMRFKTKKNEMLKKGVEEGRWTEKFVSRVQFSGDLVTASPDVYQASLGADSEFLVLASDGLWDYINSSDAVSFVRNQLRQHGDVQLACDALAEAALDRKSQDNISIVIADLGRTDWQRLPFQQQNVVYEFGQAFATIGLVSLGIWMSTSLLSS
ncbi:hypothetical protein ABKV19_024853 [Rosa sericea]